LTLSASCPTHHTRKKVIEMPTEINRPSAPTIGPAGTPPVILPEINTPDSPSLGLTPLAIAAILALVLHVAGGVMLDRSHASPMAAAFDDCVTCPAEASPPQPSLSYD
jgi:hypothetical protein